MLCFCMCACSQSATPARTAAPTSFTLYFVALNPAHPTGESIGCGDVLVSERRTLGSATGKASLLEAAVREQLAARAPAGAVNRLADLNVKLRAVTISGDRARVVLEPFSLGGECDNPRIEAQLTHVARQFSQWPRVEIFVGNRTLAEYLSLK